VEIRTGADERQDRVGKIAHDVNNSTSGAR